MGWKNLNDEVKLKLARYTYKGEKGYILISSSKSPIADFHYQRFLKKKEIELLYFEETKLYKVWISNVAVRELVHVFGYTYYIYQHVYDPLYKWEDRGK